MHEPINEVNSFVEYVIVLLRQFAGGPGPLENNMVRFGLAAILWALLFALAWSRCRRGDYPREHHLIWGFFFGFLREFYMFVHVSLRVVNPEIHDTAGFLAAEPLEHALGLIAVVVVSGSYIGYLLDRQRLSRVYLLAGLSATAVSYAIATPWWIRQVNATPELRFHQTWSAWIFHVASALLIVAAITILWPRRNWLSRVVILALSFFLLGEGIMLVNFATNREYSPIICPIGNTFHILAIPLLGYVYLREQSIEKQQTEAELAAYRGHLEELVEERTEALVAANAQLREEVRERQEAEAALRRLSRDHAMILNSAGEGIFGVDLQGRHTFVNRAAADMLGYEPQDLIGKPSHAIWHHTYPDGTPYPESECPLHNGYKSGVVCQGDDQVFWRKDGTSFPVDYVSTPIFEGGELRGAVVIFQDISERKRAEAEITARNAELAMQNAIAATISQSLDLDTILDTALETVLNELDVEAGCIYLMQNGDVLSQPRAFRRRGGAGCEPQAAWYPTPCKAASARAIDARSPVILDVTQEGKRRDAGGCASALEAATGDCTGAVLEPTEGVEVGPHRLVGVPLIAKNRAVGALTLSTRHSEGLAHDMGLLTAIGQQIGMAVENARLYRETQRWAEELAALHKASVNLTGSLELDEVYAAITAEAARLLACDAAAVLTWDPRNEDIERAHTHGLPEDANALLDTLSADGRHRLCEQIQGRRPFGLDEAEEVPAFAQAWQDRLTMHAVLGLPLSGVDRPLGCLVLFDGAEGRFWREDEIELAESFANLAALVIEKGQLHQQAERAAALEERHRIAADVHDGLAQTLSYLGHRVDGLIERADGATAREVIATADAIRDIIDQTSHQVRYLITSLQAKPEPPRSLQQQLEDVIAALPPKPALKVTLETALEREIRLPPDQAEQVIRVVQEAVYNAQRHADAGQVTIELAAADDELIVTVADDGRGFDLQQPPSGEREHFGLSIMRARAARISGHLDVTAAPGEGTRVTLRWPATGRPALQGTD